MAEPRSILIFGAFTEHILSYNIGGDLSRLVGAQELSIHVLINLTTLIEELVSRLKKHLCWKKKRNNMILALEEHNLEKAKWRSLHNQA